MPKMQMRNAFVKGSCGAYIYSVSEIPKRMWADVALLCPPWRVLTYGIPEVFAGELKPGHRVLIPLGKRKVTGMVVSLVSRSPVEDTKAIEDILDPYPLLTPELLSLTQWVADYYLSAWGEAVRAALPPGLVQGSKPFVRLLQNVPHEKVPLSGPENELFQCILEGKNRSVRMLKKKWGKEGIHYMLGRLENKGLIQVEQELGSAGVSIQTEKWISLKKSLQEVEIEALRKKAPRQAQVLDALQRLGGEASRTDLDTDPAVLRRLEKTGWIELWEEEVFRDGHREIETEPFVPHALTHSQQRVLDDVANQMHSDAFGVLLIHGVTASGKTRLYIEAVRSVLARGKTALVLIPEISLTPQAVARYRGAFGNDVAVLHSGMSSGERYDSWRAIRESRSKIAIGPRSAVFAPLSNLGLIVVDEEHEGSYKQNDPAPRYHARDTAVVRGRLNRCAVLLGSATPSMESYSNALSGKYRLCRLPDRVDDVPMPVVVLADPRETRREHPVLTPLLKQKIRERLDKNEQVILLLNRRGYANFLQCGSCGAIEPCPHCAISLTFHREMRVLNCHYCGYSRPVPDVCPKCGDSRLRYRGMGTERIEEEIHASFPGARLLRMDMDTTRRKGAHAKIVSDFGKRKCDILLGTQMVAKGHDFPGVTLVGIVSADTGLYFPDFRSGERTFQLLTQAAGRAGRKTIVGEVVIQTATPDHPVIQFARMHDYEAFYRREIEQRTELNYPPAGRLILVGFRCPDQKKASEAACFFYELTGGEKPFERLGPVPAPLSRIQGQFRYQIIYRESKTLDPSGKSLREELRNALHHYYETARFRNVRVHVDVDPMDVL